MLDSPMIQWGLLDYALSRFVEMGYVRTEAPWMVHPQVSELTHSLGQATFVDTERAKAAVPAVLVGSGEQSLLAMNLPVGSYVTCTPCFRPEPENELGRLKQRQFMKVELFVLTNERDPQALVQTRNTVMHHAALVMNELGAERGKLLPVWTPEGEDLDYSGVELGSYCIRDDGEGRVWICGTGLAEPRFSQAVPGACLPATQDEGAEELQKPPRGPIAQVLPHPTLLGHDMPPETALAMAAGENLESLVVAGFREDGSEFFCSNAADGGTCLWILGRAQHKLLSVPETHFGEE